jgi:hypothetical protein
MSFLWNFFQSGQIAKSQASADQASIKSRGNSGDIARLEERIDTLSLATNAMWELLSKNHGYTEKDLLSKMEEIDLRDGVKDGKLTSVSNDKCPDCGHIIRKRRSNCYWCGASLKDDNPFAG